MCRTAQQCFYTVLSSSAILHLLTLAAVMDATAITSIGVKGRLKRRRIKLHLKFIWLKCQLSLRLNKVSVMFLLPAVASIHVKYVMGKIVQTMKPFFYPKISDMFISLYISEKHSAMRRV